MTQQTQPEYTVEAIDDRLFRMERLAYECILNHPESKGFCTEIQHISKELREAIRSRPHTSTPPQPDKFCEYQETCARTTSATCEYCEEAYSNKWKQHDAEVAKKERERVLDEFNWMKPMCFGRHEAVCDTRCAWVVRQRCVQSTRGEL